MESKAVKMGQDKSNMYCSCQEMKLKEGTEGIMEQRDGEKKDREREERVREREKHTREIKTQKERKRWNGEQTPRPPTSFPLKKSEAAEWLRRLLELMWPMPANVACV